MKIELRMIFCLVLIHSLKTIGRGMMTIIMSVAMLIAVVSSVSALLVFYNTRVKLQEALTVLETSCRLPPFLL